MIIFPRVLLGFALLPLFSTLCLAGGPDCALVSRVIDGDTVEVSLGSETHSVRLFGVDCPELNQPGGIVVKKRPRPLTDPGSSR